MEYGKRIKELRILNGLTQEELADRCELTKGYISQLENDICEPAISTLEDIVSALGVTMADFFTISKDEKIIFKDEEYILKETDGYNCEWLVPNSQKNMMEPIKMLIKPHSQTEIDYPHEGEEFGYLLEGSCQLIIDNKKYYLKKGETFYIVSDKVHYLKNNTNKNCILIWISTPPNF